jgi:hypothetical protein
MRNTPRSELEERAYHCLLNSFLAHTKHTLIGNRATILGSRCRMHIVLFWRPPTLLSPYHDMAFSCSCTTRKRGLRFVTPIIERMAFTDLIFALLCFWFCGDSLGHARFPCVTCDLFLFNVRFSNDVVCQRKSDLAGMFGEAYLHKEHFASAIKDSGFLLPFALHDDDV